MSMATISENLQTIKDSFDSIKQAIIDKGGNVDGDITTYADAIGAIESGGNLNPTANLILNKLNGATIGDSTIHYNLETLLYTYNFSEQAVDFICFPLNIGFLTYLQQQARYSLHNSTTPYFQYLKYGYSIYPGGWGDCAIIKTPTTATTLPISVKHNGGSGLSGTGTPCKFILLCVDANGNYDFDTFFIHIGISYCYIKDTEISLYDGTIKKVQDINYNDELLVWNFDEGRYDKANPLWIKKKEITDNYYKVTLDNGNTINLVGSNGKCHRLFNYDDMKFEYATDLVGKNIHTLNGIHKVVSVENIYKTVEYYNIITNYHMNCFANGMLTSCRYNNLYPIKNMVFDKSSVEIEPAWKVNAEKFVPNPEILPMYVNGMRLNENTTMTIEEIKEYCINLEKSRKTLTDFEGNEEISNDIEETEVGWIDRTGKAYGFKHYMPGQQNHILLANQICKDLNIETDNPSRYLEKEGWLKYTTDFVLNSDDKEVNEEQLRKLRKFLKVPNKLKRDGKIRLGDSRSPHVDIEEFDTMDRYTFEYKKKHNRRNW